MTPRVCPHEPRATDASRPTLPSNSVPYARRHEERRGRGSRFVLRWSVPLLAALTSCAAEHEVFPPESPEPAELDLSTQALAGWTRGESCTPFMLQHYERAQTLAAALANSSAFRSCVRDRFQESYLDCHDDASFDNLTAAADGAIRALSEGTNITLDCTNRQGGACGADGSCPPDTECRDGFCAGVQDSAWLGPYLGWRSANLTISGFWTRDKWYSDIVAERASNPAYPWDATASNLVHEFSHAQGYQHVHDEACAMAQRGRSYYANGEPSAPYILGECAGAAVQALVRSGGNPWEDCAGPDWVRLPASYDRDENVASEPGTLVDAFSPGAACVRAKRLRGSLESPFGSFVQAVNAGGTTVTLDAPGAGDWETFSFILRTAGEFRSPATVNIRAGDGHLLRVDPVTREVRADGTSGSDVFTQFVLTIEGAAAGTQIGRNQVLSIRSVGAAAMLRKPPGLSRLYANGTMATYHWFRYRQPLREQAVFLDTNVGRRVAYTHDTSRELSTRTPAAAGARAAREEMFWLLDWDGGEIESGDRISLEGSKAPMFVSTCASGSGNLRGNHLWSTSTCAQFAIYRASGEGPIVDGTPVVLRSIAEATYWKAAGARVDVSSGAGAVPEATFTLRFVQGDAF